MVGHRLGEVGIVLRGHPFGQRCRELPEPPICRLQAVEKFRLDDLFGARESGFRGPGWKLGSGRGIACADCCRLSSKMRRIPRIAPSSISRTDVHGTGHTRFSRRERRARWRRRGSRPCSRWPGRRAAGCRRQTAEAAVGIALLAGQQLLHRFVERDIFLRLDRAASFRTAAQRTGTAGWSDSRR